MATPAFNPNSDYQAATPPPFDPGASYQAAQAKAADEPGILDRQIPLDSYTHATEQGLQNIGRGVRQAIVGSWDTVRPPQNHTEEAVAAFGGPAALIAYRMGAGLTSTAKQAAQVPGAIHDINQSPDPTGAYLGVAGRTAGEGAGQALTALATEGAVKAAPKVPAAVDVVGDAARTAINKTAGAVRAVDPDVVGIASPRAAHSLKVAQRAAKVAEKYTQAAPAETAALPSAAAEDLREPATSPQTESAGTSEEQQPPETAAPAEAPKPDTSPAAIQQKLNDALGGKPLQPNVPLRSQIPAKTAPTAASSLPEGFTPVDSSALKGYKYDPAKQELTTISMNGQTYTHAEVTPDEFKAFQDADSKGKAWNTIRQNHVLTQKNGRPTVPLGPRTVVTDPETGRPEFSDVIAARQGGEKTTPVTQAKAAPVAETAPTKTATNSTEDEDLTNLLQQSLDQVKGKQQTTKTNLGQLTEDVVAEPAPRGKAPLSADVPKYDPEKLFDQLDDAIHAAKKEGYTHFGVRVARGSKNIGEVIPNSWHEGGGVRSSENIEAELNGPAAFDAAHLEQAIKEALHYRDNQPNVHVELVGGHSASHGELLHDAYDDEGNFWPAGTEYGMPEGENAITIPQGRRLAVFEPEAPAPKTTKTNLGQLTVTPEGKGAVIPPGGVMTSAAPADLAKRWGVDESSIADTDRNLRGMNEQQSQAYIRQLADSYKKGQPVQPVMETRDANNNIISVDGRHRALAAQRAGIERIPVIVRRTGTVR